MVPLCKGCDKLNLGNYRPISVLNIYSKIFEKIVHGQNYSYLENKNILSDEQFGFRTGRGTTQAIIKHITDIYI